VFYHWTLEAEKPKEKDKSQVLLRINVPDLTLLGGFLDQKECAEIIAQASVKLSASTVMDEMTGRSVVHENRTSSGTSFARGETPLIREIERRIAEITGIPLENGEGIQILRYEEGQEYKPHYDYFPDDQPGSALHTQHGGQRIATILMYLSTPEEGGSTIFPDAGPMEVLAVEGNALLFRYNTPTRETRTLHGGGPVLKGVKWVATKWLRLNEYKH
jgi:prolyl 4-hydroxylase